MGLYGEGNDKPGSKPHLKGQWLLGLQKRRFRGTWSLFFRPLKGCPGSKRRDICVAPNSKGRNPPKDRVQLCKENHFWSGCQAKVELIPPLQWHYWFKPDRGCLPCLVSHNSECSLFLFHLRRALHEDNVSVNMFVVNKPWLFSIIWCAGVDSVTTNDCQLLQHMRYPAWLLVRAPRLLPSSFFSLPASP